MRDLVIENYKNHPKFTIESEPLRVSNNLFQAFKESYGDPKSKVTKQAFVDSLKIVEQIFDELRHQSRDEKLTWFLNELEHEVKQLMIGDFPFRTRLSSRTSELVGMALELKINNHFFGTISPEAVEEILSIGSESLSRFRENAKKGLLKRSDLSVDSGPVVSKIARVIDREFKRLGIFEEVSRFVGVDYRFTGMSLELSYEGSTWWRDAIGNERAPKTMYAHLDESIFAPKSIVYLSKVSSENGPTSLYPGAYEEMGNNPLQDIIGRVVGRVGNSPTSKLRDYYRKGYHQSAGSPEFREHFMMLPEEIRFNSHLGWEVRPDSELEKVLSNREVEMLGPAGTFIVFDGSNLLHRGGLIERGERIVLQVVFYPGTRFTHRLKLAWNLLRSKLGRQG